MNDIQIDIEIDLLFMVLYVLELSTNEWMIFVWDGIYTTLLTFTHEVWNLGRAVAEHL